LFTALEDQLGLKLEANRGPVNVVVIDAVLRPTIVCSCAAQATAP